MAELTGSVAEDFSEARLAAKGQLSSKVLPWAKDVVWMVDVQASGDDIDITYTYNWLTEDDEYFEKDFRYDSFEVVDADEMLTALKGDIEATGSPVQRPPPTEDPEVDRPSPGHGKFIGRYYAMSKRSEAATRLYRGRRDDHTTATPLLTTIGGAEWQSYGVDPFDASEISRQRFSLIESAEGTPYLLLFNPLAGRAWISSRSSSGPRDEPAALSVAGLPKLMQTYETDKTLIAHGLGWFGLALVDGESPQGLRKLSGGLLIESPDTPGVDRFCWIDAESGRRSILLPNELVSEGASLAPVVETSGFKTTRDERLLAIVARPVPTMFTLHSFADGGRSARLRVWRDSRTLRTLNVTATDALSPATRDRLLRVLVRSLPEDALTSAGGTPEVFVGPDAACLVSAAGLHFVAGTGADGLRAFHVDAERIAAWDDPTSRHLPPDLQSRESRAGLWEASRGRAYSQVLITPWRVLRRENEWGANPVGLFIQLAAPE